MVTDGRYTCEHSIMYEDVESLCCVPETNATLYVNYIKIKKLKINYNSNNGKRRKEGSLKLVNSVVRQQYQTPIFLLHWLCSQIGIIQGIIYRHANVQWKTLSLVLYKKEKYTQ